MKVEDTERPETDWPAKIAKAKEARKAGQQARKGKLAALPLAFPWGLKYRKGR